MSITSSQLQIDGCLFIKVLMMIVVMGCTKMNRMHFCIVFTSIVFWEINMDDTLVSRRFCFRAREKANCCQMLKHLVQSGKCLHQLFLWGFIFFFPKWRLRCLQSRLCAFCPQLPTEGRSHDQNLCNDLWVDYCCTLPSCGVTRDGFCQALQLERVNDKDKFVTSGLIHDPQFSHRKYFLWFIILWPEVIKSHEKFCQE